MNDEYNGNSGFKKKANPKNTIKNKDEQKNENKTNVKVIEKKEEKPPEPEQEPKEEDPTLIYGRNANIKQPLVKIKDILYHYRQRKTSAVHTTKNSLHVSRS